MRTLTKAMRRWSMVTSAMGDKMAAARDRLVEGLGVKRLAAIVRPLVDVVEDLVRIGNRRP